MDYNLSYIIPAYNAVSYIDRCIDSILALPIKNGYEIIVIDDCSTDSTREIVNSYTIKYPFVHLICQSENHKQGAARNRGLEIAKGEYVAFIDADDVVENGVAIALERALKEELDICFYGMKHEKADGTYREVKYDMPTDIVVTGFQFLNTYLDMDVNGPTKGVFRRKMIADNHLIFVENIQWEDGDFCLKLYSYANSIGNISNIGYVYKRNEKSTNFSPSYSALIARLKLGLRMIAFVKDNKDNLSKGAEIILSDVQHRYVHDVIRVRNLSKYSVSDNFKVSNALLEEDRIILYDYAYSKWEKNYLRHPILAKILLAVICPMASSIRFILTIIRRLH